MLTLGVVACSILAFDQVTKHLVLHYLAPSGPVVIIPNVFRLNFVQNTGIAFGLFQGHPEFWTWIITSSVFLLLALSPLFARRSFVQKTAYGFILGGALGNWIDRLRYQHVVDFLDVYVWPVFNVADSFITIGVLMFAWLMVREH